MIQMGLRVPFAVFVAVAGLVSVCQADYINADFVAYSMIAHRVIESPASSVTGSWSPLYSWLMVPLLRMGIADIVAGRIILLISGLSYIAGVHRLATRFFPSNLAINRLMIHGLMTCATVQAIWFSTYLLNPDLLASAIVFWYFAAVLDERTASNPRRSFVAGMMLGMAYLAKAYMLPFCVVQLLVFTAINSLFKLKPGTTAQPSLGMRPLLSMVLGLGIVAGPWITVLTLKYDRLTITNAGRANHANVGPGSFGKDPLWHPPLTRDYILEPVIADEWSPFANFENFRHQMHVTMHNAGNCVGLIPGWLILSGLAVLLWLMNRRAAPHPGGQIVWWAVLTALVYCSGYLMVNLEARYIVPVVAPLLCLSAAGLIRETVLNSFTSEQTKVFRLSSLRTALMAVKSERRLSVATVIVVACFAVVDIHSLVCVAIFHPQSSSLSQFRAIARKLDEAGVEDQLNSSNRWHDGLYLAYVRGNVSNYLGSPQATDPLKVQKELLSNGVGIHFNWNSIDRASNAATKVCTEDPSCQCRLIIVDKSLGAQAVEVYFPMAISAVMPEFLKSNLFPVNALTAVPDPLLRNCCSALSPRLTASKRSESGVGRSLRGGLQSDPCEEFPDNTTSALHFRDSFEWGPTQFRSRSSIGHSR